MYTLTFDMYSNHGINLFPWVSSVVD